MKKNLVLLGMMAVGKSTLGKIVSKKQGLEFVDIDETIEGKNAMTVSQIFEKKREKFFRNEEENEVLKYLEKKNFVISLGGGAFINKTLRENILKKAVSIWLDADIETLIQRVKWNKKRPLLKNEDSQKKMQDLYDKRKDIYKLANHKIKCDNLEQDVIAKKIIEIYEKY